jgi:hypothetical protein
MSVLPPFRATSIQTIDDYCRLRSLFHLELQAGLHQFLAGLSYKFVGPVHICDDIMRHRLQTIQSKMENKSSKPRGKMPFSHLKCKPKVIGYTDSYEVNCQQSADFLKSSEYESNWTFIRESS